MNINFKRGFTLIELLVVIAIIGILASVVLASLNTARDKGRDASAKSSMSQMRAQAELGQDDAGTYLADLCSASGDGGLGDLVIAVAASTGVTPSCAQDVAAGSRPGAWAASATLLDGTYYCVDSAGYSGVSTAAPATEVADTACNDA